jgi:hypothetical protein
MTRKIILGNSDGYVLDEEIKQKAIDYLYSNLDLSKYRFIMLNIIQKLKFLQENEHYVSPNFKGYNYLLIMFTHNNKKYCVAIDRKKLSYHKNQLDMKTIQIIQIQMNVSEIIFSGTIFDGKLIFSNNKYIFLIQDCFYLMGKKMVEIEISQKILHLDTILKTHFRKDKNIYCPNFEFKLNKLYKYQELEKLIDNLPKLSIGTNGLIFYPKFSGINIIYIEKKIENVSINTNNKNIIEQKSYDIIHNFVDVLKLRTYSYESGEKTKNLWLSRTLIPDVYDITENANGEKQGIAMIPNLKISQMCDTLITDDKPYKFNCIFSNKFKKWIPLNILV